MPAPSLRYAVIDGCPVPRLLAGKVRELKRAVPGARLQSCYRGTDAESLLRRLGKSSQRALWLLWQRRAPGANPANPPGRSTHELRSDGVAYPGPVGRKLSYWQVGMDWDDAHIEALIRAAKRRGWVL